MPFAITNPQVTNSAVMIVNPANASNGDPLPAVIFNNDTTNTLFIGGPTVTSTTGFPILKQTGISFRLISGEQIWAVTAGPTIDTRVMTGRS